MAIAISIACAGPRHEDILWRAMNLIDLARIYADLVKLEKQVSPHEYQAKDLINALRTKYHEAFMAKMKEENIRFSDRFRENSSGN